ncbi:MAG: F0F1 ATP synthase subunit A, partial [Vicinamibacteria bacterium]
MLPGFIAGEGQGGESLGDRIIHHVSNGPSFATIKLGGLDLSLSKHVVLLWISAAVVLGLFLWYAGHLRRSKDGVPKGSLAHMVDFFVEYIHRQLVEPMIGKEHASSWTPLICAFFFFILTNNLLGLTPLYDIIGHFVPAFEGGGTATGNFNVTAGLAVVTFSAIILAGSIVHG